MKGIYIFLADGFEISEALTTVNMLRRGGVNVKTVSIYDDRIVTSSNRIPVIADMAFGEFKASTSFGPCLPTDIMIFPGGMPGSSNLAAFGKLMDIMQQHYAEGGTLAAICAAPSVVLGRDFGRVCPTHRPRNRALCRHLQAHGQSRSIRHSGMDRLHRSEKHQRQFLQCNGLATTPSLHRTKRILRN